jgi:hypothetical protein
MDLIYEHESGGKLYQCGAGEIPGTPQPWYYKWYRDSEKYPPKQRQIVHDSICEALNSLEIHYLVLVGEYQPKFKTTAFETLSYYFDDKYDMNDTQSEVLLAMLKPLIYDLAGHLSKGRNILSTCWAGVNRSSLVSGLTLKALKNDSKPLFQGQEVIDLIRDRRRPTCFNNPIFYDLVLYNSLET